MQVVGVSEASTQGPRKEMQDIVMHEKSPEGAYFLGVFDGHGDHGAEVARRASAEVQNLAKQPPRRGDALFYATLVRSCLRSLDRKLAWEDRQSEREKIAQASGTTATVAIVKSGRMAIAYIGDSEAVYYEDDGTVISPVKPHNFRNAAEVTRVQALGYRVTTLGFGGALAVSRAIGDHKYAFVLPEPEVRRVPFTKPGIVIVTSDGVLGSGTKDHHETVKNMVQESDPHELDELAHNLVHTFAEYTGDNAAVVAARIE